MSNRGFLRHFLLKTPVQIHFWHSHLCLATPDFPQRPSPSGSSPYGSPGFSPMSSAGLTITSPSSDVSNVFSSGASSSAVMGPPPAPVNNIGGVVGTTVSAAGPSNITAGEYGGMTFTETAHAHRGISLDVDVRIVCLTIKNKF